jgi:hypothetical protein
MKMGLTERVVTINRAGEPSSDSRMSQISVVLLTPLDPGLGNQSNVSEHPGPKTKFMILGFKVF